MTPQPSQDFGKQLEELEKITAELESGEVDLDQGLVRFERGMKLVAALKERLHQAENEVEKIKLKYDQAPDKPAPSAEPDEAADLDQIQF